MNCSKQQISTTERDWIVDRSVQEAVPVHDSNSEHHRRLAAVTGNWPAAAAAAAAAAVSYKRLNAEVIATPQRYRIHATQHSQVLLNSFVSF